MKSYHRASALAGISMLAVIVGAQPALAQAQQPADQQQGGSLEEIVVTAQRRSENVQRVPISVTAYSADRLETAGIVKVSDLVQVDSSLVMPVSQGTLTPFIRGLGNPVISYGNEASVPIYIDDVYFLQPSTVYFDLANIQQVEILKGPQGTLFGRNASLGVVSLRTRDPGQDTVVQAKVGFANYETYSGQLYVATPITDNLAIDLSVSGHNQKDGWGRNLLDGREISRDKSISIRSKIVWKPGPSTEFKLTGYYGYQFGDYSVLNQYYKGTTSGGADISGTIVQPPLTVPGFYNSNVDLRQFNKMQGWGGSLHASQDLGFADVVSITAARNSKISQASDGDLSPLQLANYFLYPKDRQFSQELQLKSHGDSRASWILGAYYLNATEGYDPVIIRGQSFAVQGIDQTEIIGVQNVRSYATFAQATYPIFDNTKLTGGVRYTIDKLRARGLTTIRTIPGSAFANAVGPTFIAQDSNPEKQFKKLTYKVAVDHQFSRDVLGYISYSRGYKSGTFNILPLSPNPLQPEVSDSYEAGIKSELFERRVRLNAAIFRVDLKNPQVQSSFMGLVSLLNAGAAVSQGLEFDASASLARGLVAQLGGTYLQKAKFTDFTSAPFFTPRPGGGLNVGPGDASGNRLPQAAKIRLTGGLSYEFDVKSFGQVSANVNAVYSSRYAWDADNSLYQEPMALVNASIGLHPASMENLEVRVWGKNLTNHKYYAFQLEQEGLAGHTSTAAAPRTYGVELSFKY